MRLGVGPLCGRLLETGSKLASPTTGSPVARLYGLKDGRRNKLQQDVVTKKSADAHTTTALIAKAEGCCRGSGVGLGVFDLIKNKFE
jgi:hypothetical protein